MLVLSVALLFSQPVLGQDAVSLTPTVSSTATPTEPPAPTITPTFPPTPVSTIEGFAVDGNAEVIFPEAIRFTLSLSRPASEVASVRLIIETVNQPPHMPNLDLVEIIKNAEPEAFLAYNWTLPEDGIPPLFSSVGFVWEVEANDGEIARVEGMVEFTDQRVVWISHQPIPDRLTILAARDIPVRLIQRVGAVYELVSENTGLSPEFRLLLYDSAVSPGCTIRTLENGDEEAIAVAPFSGEVSFCRPGFAEEVYDASGYAVFQRASGLDVESSITEYIVGDVYDRLWDRSDVPAWFEVGLKTFYTPALKTDLLPIVQIMARNNRLFSLDAMNGAPPDDPELLEQWRAQSYGMLLYLAEQVGVQGVFDLAAALGDGAVFSDVYLEMTEVELGAMIPGWQVWIFTRRAELVYGITPYQPSTPTYTPTFTDTATRIPTATLSPSMTFTPSVTGALSATPYPTLTASLTPTPEPPTVTPRPAQRTPTPTSVSPFAGLSAPGVQGGLIVGLLIAIGILVYAYIRVGRR
jgi:hypothetical protein